MSTVLMSKGLMRMKEGAMSSEIHLSRALVVSAVFLLALGLVGCDEPTSKPGAASATTATTSAAAPTTSTKTASKKKKKPSHPCPEGTTGEGSFKEPCKATGKTRIMEVKWTGKIGDKGPSFKVTSKAKLEILYGNIIVYFYDKAGKQLEVGGGGKARKWLSCGGNIFAGPMKAGEKAVLTFSCVKKKHVPEGTAAIEGELKTVGFTAKSGKRADTYWRNTDLAPKERPKGGIK